MKGGPYVASHGTGSGSFSHSTGDTLLKVAISKPRKGTAGDESDMQQEWTRVHIRSETRYTFIPRLFNNTVPNLEVT